MAKIQSILTINGTLAGITFINTGKNGVYARAKRGTYTAITLSEGMKVSSVELAHCNKMAKIIFDAVIEFAPGFKDGRLWSRLLSVFRKQKKAGNGYNYTDFKNLEVRLDYPSSKLGQFYLNIIDGIATLNYDLRNEEEYMLSIMRIATDETLLIPYPTEILVFQTNEAENNGQAEYGFSPLAEGAKTLYILKAERLINGKSTRLMAGKSVKFLGSG